MRLIPAHAGKTVSDAANVAALAAHPRSRGENRVCAGILDGQVGSSPLTRGKQLSRPLKRPSTRLNPAHAGKTAA